MKATVVGLVTPHVLRILDLATQAETGVNVDWHMRDAVKKSIEDLGQQYNAPELLSAYVHGLESAAQEAAQGRKGQASVLRTAAELAASNLKERG